MLAAKIIIWCVLGYCGGWLFAKKGYSPTIGMAVGILLGPIALAICAILPRSREGREQAALEKRIAIETATQNSLKRCPQCGRDLAFSARVCPRCEHRFENRG